MVLVPPGEEGVQPLSMVTIQGARQKPSKSTTSHLCIQNAFSACALRCDANTYNAYTRMQQRGGKCKGPGPFWQDLQ